MLILTTLDHDRYVIEALGAGAAGFLIKNTEPGQLLHGIRVVACGEALLSPGLTRRLIARFRDTRSTRGRMRTPWTSSPPGRRRSSDSSPTA